MMDWSVVFVRWMEAAYMYYWLDDSDIPDGIWDSLGRDLKDHWDDFEHPAKVLVEFEHMNSLHYVPKAKFLEYFPDLPLVGGDY